MPAETLLRWYRELIAKKFDGSKYRESVGRPPVDEEIENLVVCMARRIRAGVTTGLWERWPISVTRSPITTGERNEAGRIKEVITATIDFINPSSELARKIKASKLQKRSFQKTPGEAWEDARKQIAKQAKYAELSVAERRAMMRIVPPGETNKD